MSYSPYSCRQEFTAQQALRMKTAIANLSLLQATTSTSCPFLSNLTNVCFAQASTATIYNLSGATTTWSVSSNVQIVSSNNSSVNVKALNSAAVGEGWIKAVLSNGIELFEYFDVGLPVLYPEVQFSNGVDGPSEYLCSSHSGNAYDLSALGQIDQHQFRIKNLSGTVLYTSSVISGNSGSINYTPSAGWYEFEFKASNTCGWSDWNSTYIEYVNCASEMYEQFSIFPNPAKDALNIKHLGEDIALRQNFSFELLNSRFERILSGTLTTLQRLDVSNFEEGNYILRIYNTDSSRSYHVIIK